MTQDRIVQADFDWWLLLASALEWTFARTYAQTAPHSYVVLGRTAGMTTDDYVRAAKVIHTFGSPANFYDMTSIYLTSPDGRLKWWTMDLEVTKTNLINQATSDRLYGVQNAPSTVSGIETVYDSLATAYYQLHPASDKMTKTLRGAVASLSGDFPPAVLDVGCGTGRVLDLGVTTPDRYAGVDPSQPMLNQLVRKHPNIGALYPMRIEQALATELFTPGQFEIVTALLSDADRLDDEAIAGLARIASRGLIVASGDELTVVDTRR
jgi:hypothetical protein